MVSRNRLFAPLAWPHGIFIQWAFLRLAEGVLRGRDRTAASALSIAVTLAVTLRAGPGEESGPALRRRILCFISAAAIVGNFAPC